MQTFHLLSLFVDLAVIIICVAQDGPIKLEPPEIPSTQLLTIKPIIIWPSLCLLAKMPQGCNPCQYGQPLTSITCGRGEMNCTTHGGTCKVNQQDRAYCCPNEHPGCCPATHLPIIILPNPTSFCQPQCHTDAQCPYHQKCCGTCPQCVNATFTQIVFDTNN